MNIYVVRHGESEANKLGVIGGQRLDAPLTDRGKTQAKESVENIPSSINKIISSPQLRAKQTAEIIADALQVGVELNEALMERDFGDITGKKWPEIVEEHGKELTTNERNLEYDYTPFGGESYSDVEKRLRKFLDELKSRSLENVLLVTHNGTIRVLHNILSDSELEKSKNAEVHEFTL